MNLILHAGIHRTGTSSLQEFLAANLSVLADHGFFYPGDTKNHQPLAWSIKRGEAGAEEVLSIISGCGDSTVILSAEDFCIHKDLSWLSEVASRVPTTACFYLRRQDHWLMSWYNQHIKWPFDKDKSRMSAAEFLGKIADFYWIDFAQLIERWELALGQGSVRVALVEPEQVVDVIDDFVGHLGYAGGELKKPTTRINNSMPIHLLEIARHLGLYEMPPAMRIKAISTLRKVFPTGPDMPATVYSPAQRRAILDRFADSNSALAMKLFQRKQLFLESDPDDADPYYQFPDVTPDEYLSDWIKPLIHHLLKK